MAAGLGFKTFNSGDVLSAADVNGYLMQGVLVFASTAARDAAITAPAEGQFAFTKDTNGLWFYDGAAWVASGATGDIEGVTAGIGISGGGTSGTVTVTNSMATAIDAKGDLVVGTGADTFSRLAVGTNNQRIVAASGQATGLQYVGDTVNTVIDAEGDLLVGDSADTLQRLALGTNAQVLTVDTTVDGKIKWATPSGGSSTFAGCLAYRVTSATVAATTNTAITLTAEKYDTDGYHDNSTNTSRMTIPAGKAGYYQITANLITANTTSSNDVSIAINGTRYVSLGYTGNGGNEGHSLSIIAYLAVSDYVEMKFYNGGGSALTVYGEADVTDQSTSLAIGFLGA